MHEQSIIDAIIGKLDTDGVELKPISLIYGESELRKRLEGDVSGGLRTADVIERSVAGLDLLEVLDTVKAETSGRSPRDIADQIANL